MKLLFLPFLLLIALQCDSQQTGSFTIEETFSESDYMFTRNLYFFVPSSYDSEESYPLVIGFRGGPHTNAGQFRDQLSFLADSIGAIIMCPENEDHFWNNEGLTKQLYTYSLEKAMTLYNINTDFIYLTGLSYGGRHATIISMDTDSGNIPSLRGVIPFAAGSESDLQPNYDSISDFPPACICIGLDDSANFISVSNNLHNDIQNAGGISQLNEIDGIGHTVDFPTYSLEMMECLEFIENSYLINSISINKSKASSISLYPNPAIEYIQIQYAEKPEVQSIEIIDLTGKMICEYSSESEKIYLEKIPAGTYFLILYTSSGTIREKFQIIK